MTENAIPRMVVLATVLMAGLMAGPNPSPGQEGSSTPVWACTLPDGSVVYADRELSGTCEPVEGLPPLQRRKPFPRPSDVPAPEDPDPSPAIVPSPTPVPGGGRRSDPPADDVIRITDVEAVGSFNGVLGLAHYEATMVLENLDATWVAEKVCVDVRFRDRSHIFVDVHQVGCTTELLPFTPKTLSITYTGIMPPRPVPVEAEASVEFVQWSKPGSRR